jgi:hypothetical protein
MRCSPGDTRALQGFRRLEERVGLVEDSQRQSAEQSVKRCVVGRVEQWPVVGDAAGDVTSGEVKPLGAKPVGQGRGDGVEGVSDGASNSWRLGTLPSGIMVGLRVLYTSRRSGEASCLRR